MKVFYTASYKGKSKYQKYYDLILKKLQECKVDIISPELGNYLDLLTESDKKTSNLKALHYKAIRDGILAADAVVIEISEQDFQLGHEATLAIQNKKPVLCLSLHEDYSEKIRNPFFRGARYNEYNIGNIVRDFLKKSEVRLYKERFNLFLSNDELRYLEKASKKSKVSKSEYLRYLIDKDKIQF